MTFRLGEIVVLRGIILAGLMLVAGVAPALASETGPAWAGYANSAQHTSAAPAAPQSMTKLHWATKVDLDPTLDSGGELLIHYGSPMITAANTVVVPTRVSATQGFRLRAVAGATGTAVWSLKTDWIEPPHDWEPPLPATLGPDGSTVFVAGAGGTILRRLNTDSATGTVKRVAFMGTKAYNANKSAYDSTVMVCTPITADTSGAIYFGFCVTGSAPGGLQSGWARIAANGTVAVTSAATATGDAGATDIAINAAPAVSNDGATIYVAAVGGNGPYLLGLDATTLAPKYKAALRDPSNGLASVVHVDSSASPMVAPDGDVYFGTLENVFGSHNDRGWMLHYDATLTTEKTPGSFGWDNTMSVLPASALTGYEGSATYLLVSKYNNYLASDVGAGTGDGLNRVALLDPTATEPDPVTPAVTVMREVETVLSPKQDPNGPTGARYEWCINAAVVDANTASVIVNSEAGIVYRWDLKTNKLAEHLHLNAPRSEAYTPTLIGPDGTIYAINNSKLYAIGN
jgi:hypothetical protein